MIIKRTTIDKVLGDVSNKNTNNGQSSGGSNNSDNSTSSVNNYQDLISALETINKKYSTEYNAPKLDLPSSLNQQKLEYTVPSMDSLTQEAKTSLAKKYADKANTLTQNSQKNINSIHNAIDKEQLEALFKANQLTEVLDDNIKNVKVNAIKRGVARSSILNSGVEEAQNNYQGDVDNVEQSKDAEINLLNKKIKQIVETTQNAYNALNGVYDVDTQATAKQMLEKALEQQQNIIKYNNTLEANEQKYVASAEKSKEDAKSNEVNRQLKILQLLKDIGPVGVENIKLTEMVNTVKTYLDGMSKLQAQNVLKNDTLLKIYLGDYYTSIVDFVNNKK